MTTYPPKNILIYCSFNQRSVHIESIASEVKKSGQHVIVLTTCEKGALHEELEKLGVKTFSKTFEKKFGPIFFPAPYFFPCIFLPEK